MRDAGFVAHVDDADAFARRHGQHFVQMIAHQRENVVESPTVRSICTNSSAPFGIELSMLLQSCLGLHAETNPRYRRRRIHRFAYRQVCCSSGATTSPWWTTSRGATATTSAGAAAHVRTCARPTRSTDLLRQTAVRGGDPLRGLHRWWANRCASPELYFENNVGGIAFAADRDGAGRREAHRVLLHRGVYGNPHTVADPGRLPDSAGEPVRRIEGDGGEDAALVRRDPHGLRSVCLRYFNASGADPEGGWAKSTSRRRT